QAAPSCGSSPHRLPGVSPRHRSGSRIREFRSLINERALIYDSAVSRPKAATKEGIMDAALAVFHERGYEGTTIPAIAERAGVAQGTLYNYFPSKEKLLFACARAGGAPGAIFGELRADVGRRPVSELLEE